MHTKQGKIFERFPSVLGSAHQWYGPRLGEMNQSNTGSRYPVVECVVPIDDLEWASAELYELGTVGIEELNPAALTSPRTNEPNASPQARDRASNTNNPDRTDRTEFVGLRAGFPSEAMAQAAALFLLDGEAERRVPWQPTVEIIVGDDWLDAWREHFEPLRAGRIVVAPAWKRHDGSLANDPILVTLCAQDIVVWLEPGRAWGTGAHASTSLCLSALQRELSLDPESKHVLDVGCGSGVLGVASLLAGASSVYGVDIDETSPGVTMENAERNGVALRCRASTESLSQVSGTYELVLANILAPVLIELSLDIAKRVAVGGALVLAGLIEEQRDRVLAAYPSFVVEHTDHQGEWVGLTLRRPLE
jgi:ribosomal protein L11 methyltransferase